MANPKGNLATLKSYTPKWNSGKTRTIRVPVLLANRLLEIARQLDNDSNSLSQVKDEQILIEAITVLTELHDSTPRNNFSKERRARVKEIRDKLQSLVTVNEG